MNKDLLYQSLIKSILSGECIPGDPLPSQRALAQESSLSRSTIREVVQTIELAGLIETQPGGRSVIKNLIKDRSYFDEVVPQTDLSFQRQVIEVRAFLEGEAAYYAAARATNAQLERIDCEYQSMLRRSQGQTTLKKAKADLKFHTVIAESCHHLLITSFSQLFYERFFNVIYEVLNVTLKRHGRYPDRIRSQHEGIHQALMQRDADAARAAAKEHIIYTAQLLD